MRSFIAIDIDSKVRENLKDMVTRFKKVSSKIKWVKPEAMHLTLKFLGNINKKEADQIKEIMDNVSAGYSIFHLECKGIGTFPQRSRKPKIIWAGIKENTSLKALQSHLETELEKIGFLREKRSFHSHLTLGRVKKNAEVQRLLPELEINQDSVFGKTKVDRLTLFKSTLTPSGAIYDILYESPLK